MRYRSPLLTDGSLGEAAQLLTDAQWRRIALWSAQLGQDVMTILRSAQFMAEQINEASQTVMLTGTLPHCGLYGGLMPDGSTHT